jgi:hypothetical protein
MKNSAFSMPKESKQEDLGRTSRLLSVDSIRTAQRMTHAIIIYCYEHTVCFMKRFELSVCLATIGEWRA